MAHFYAIQLIELAMFLLDKMTMIAELSQQAAVEQTTDESRFKSQQT